MELGGIVVPWQSYMLTTLLHTDALRVVQVNSLNLLDAMKLSGKASPKCAAGECRTLATVAGLPTRLLEEGAHDSLPLISR